MEKKIFLNEGFKIVKFLFNVFIVTDIAILVRVLFMNYGKKLETHNVVTLILIFGVITVLLYLLKIAIKIKLNKDQIK